MSDPNTSHGSRKGPWQPPDPRELQQQIPQYKVLELLGQGGMGAVYKGWQVSLERYVAIKILPPDIEDGDAQFAARFKQEAKMMAKFMHPGIVAVFDAGETPSALLYIVMEFVEGTDVAQMLKRKGLLDPATALAITANVCDALHYAHARGVMHRDIKPANIMVNEEGVVKVADFGLAKASGSMQMGLTRSDMSMGTPDFIAPEALMLGVVADHRADLYAMGVMLYNMLTGEVPRGRFRAASARTGCDARFDAIIDRAMEQDREHRYQSSQEIRRDLDVILTTPMEKAPPEEFGATMPMMKSGPVAMSEEVPLHHEPPPKRPAPQRSEKPPPRKSTDVPRKSSAGLMTGVFAGVAALGLVSFFLLHKPAADVSSTAPVTGTSAPLTQGTGATFATATKDAPFVNSLGMKFVPVPITGGPTHNKRILFSVWDTRVQDYGAKMTEKHIKWDKPPFEQGPTHPAVNVNWDEATAFCEWLTYRERKAGKIGANEVYRLPSDHEWSCAVGIGDKEDAALLPAEKKGKIDGVFGWGSTWPPPDNTANVAGEELRPMLEKVKTFVSDGLSHGVIENYHDGYAFTSPVESFAPNPLGLYDMGGNVQQWCEDWNSKDQKKRTLRGASWVTQERVFLLSSNRPFAAPADRFPWRGFRVVLAPATSTAPGGA